MFIKVQNHPKCQHMMCIPKTSHSKTKEKLTCSGQKMNRMLNKIYSVSKHLLHMKNLVIQNKLFYKQTNFPCYCIFTFCVVNPFCLILPKESISKIMKNAYFIFISFIFSHSKCKMKLE